MDDRPPGRHEFPRHHPGTDAKPGHARRHEQQETPAMNFLAHALLAGDDPALIVGGVTGDWIKGLLPGALPPDLARGVALHRAIDSHAESNAGFGASRHRISPSRRRYAGVLVDIFYDHLLARDWASHHPQPLAEYAGRTYALIAARHTELPTAAQPALRLMASEDWLGNYDRIDAIADVLLRMSRRARQPNPLAGGEAELLRDIDGFTADFRLWLTDARLMARAWAAKNE
jgi:acyl carrier protein phosphodiesterase